MTIYDSDDEMRRLTLLEPQTILYKSFMLSPPFLSAIPPFPRLKSQNANRECRNSGLRLFQRNQVLISYLIPNYPNMARIAEKFLLFIEPDPKNEKIEKILYHNTKLALTEPRIHKRFTLVGPAKILDGSKTPKQETYNRNSGPAAAPIVGKEIYPVELMTILLKDILTPDRKRLHFDEFLISVSQDSSV